MKIKWTTFFFKCFKKQKYKIKDIALEKYIKNRATENSSKVNTKIDRHYTLDTYLHRVNDADAFDPLCVVAAQKQSESDHLVRAHPQVLQQKHGRAVRCIALYRHTPVFVLFRQQMSRSTTSLLVPY